MIRTINATLPILRTTPFTAEIHSLQPHLTRIPVFLDDTGMKPADCDPDCPSLSCMQAAIVLLDISLAGVVVPPALDMAGGAECTVVRDARIHTHLVILLYPLAQLHLQLQEFVTAPTHDSVHRCDAT